jgi:cellobiose phosphorylase
LHGNEKDVKSFKSFYREQKDIVNDIAWDGEWYRRAIMDNGHFLGTKTNEEAKIWLNAQSWSIISGYAGSSRARESMNTVNKYLDTSLGIKILHPPITTFPSPDDPLTHYNKGTGENAAIFCHANTWAIIAECMLGRGDRAWKYYRQLIPVVAMKNAGPWRYKSEPYVYCSNLFGPDSDKFGLANVSGLSGTAAWMYVAATPHILGVQPTWEGLRISPCLPSRWREVDIHRYFRGTQYHIRVFQSPGQDGIKLIVDGEPVSGDIIPEADKDFCHVEVYV